ncbi:PoNe immunity protein domain-containing protein [Pseudoalteromonas piscicida]|uniref:PoNe immunity protein domain-containing protein n=1 Tax=Pseudoalteromonas piscicida TaxID=43662 RepID=UPI000E35E123|nr:PoNe immunity protein domain-containing protein [Pseudoalteromonas piscicida]AXR00025.1 DUF1911 domain-containing protein [Pseudoalteromonas piscicida]
MVRDTFRDKSYFDEAVEFYEETILEDVAELDSSDLTIEIKMRTCFDLINNIISLMHVKYSRGDSVIEFNPLLNDAITYRRAQKKFADELPLEAQAERIDLEELHQSDLRNYLKLFCFAYCLNMGKDYYLQLLELIGNQGQDALFDKIAIALGDTDREIAADTLFKKRFDKLYKVVEGSPEQRPALAKSYMEAWYVLEESPDIHLLDNDAYDGYWCWEIALVVKLFNIDDSSFIDHPYYPKDLVHWQENQ